MSIQGIKNKGFFLILLLALSCSTAQLGVNISLPERGGTFVDVVKENYRWSVAGSGGELTANQVDNHGWPTVDARYVLDYRPVAEWANSIDDPEAYRIDVSGTYTCAFTGQATMKVIAGCRIENETYDPGSNLTTFNLIVSGPVGPGHGLIIFEFTQTKRSGSSPVGSGFTNFRMIRPGYTLNTTKTFTDKFIAALTGIKFSVVRFMCFTGTNGREPTYPDSTTWQQRKLPTDASQVKIASINKQGGAAWEYVIELSNLTKMDPWINIPLSVTDEYVKNVAKLFKDRLDPSLTLYVESSNEVWNTAPAFNQSLYNQAEAQALGINEHNNHARRSVELAQLFESVYGAGSLNNQVRVILCSHKPMLKWWVEPMLQYVESNFGPPKNYFNAIACQTYFSGGEEAGDPVSTILDKCHSSITQQVDEAGQTNEAGRKQWIASAKKWQLAGGFCSYEGGPDHGGGSTTNIGNRIQAERHERMAREWYYNLDDCFFKLGANIAAQFTLSSAYTRYGCWGLTDDITKPNRNPKYAAAKKLADSLHANPISIPMQNQIKSNEILLYHNHLSNTLSLQLNLTKPNTIQLSLVNLQGKRIRKYKTKTLQAGTHRVNWDLRTGSIPLTNGVYTCLILLGNKTLVEKIFVTK